MDRRRYMVALGFRVLLSAAALVVAARAAHELRSDAQSWFLAMLFAGSAAALLVWPLVVPVRSGSAVHTLGPSFLLAGMFLLPTGPLVAEVAFAIALAGVIVGTRFHKLTLDLSIGVLTYGGASFLFRLAPRPADTGMPYASLAATEALMAASVLIAQLLLRSILLRIERGVETPHWGAFRGHTIIEGLYCVALAVTVSLLARLHPALLTLVYAEIGIVCWFLSRYRRRVRDLTEAAASSRESPRRAA
jgi:hypothetical protein